jgi:hypothetical protein
VRRRTAAIIAPTIIAAIMAAPIATVIPIVISVLAPAIIVAVGKSRGCRKRRACEHDGCNDLAHGKVLLAPKRARARLNRR